MHVAIKCIFNAFFTRLNKSAVNIKISLSNELTKLKLGTGLSGQLCCISLYVWDATKAPGGNMETAQRKAQPRSNVASIKKDTITQSTHRHEQLERRTHYTKHTCLLRKHVTLC